MPGGASRAAVLQELERAQRDGSYRLSQFGEITPAPAADARAKAGKTRMEVRQELLTRSDAEKRQQREIYIPGA